MDLEVVVSQGEDVPHHPSINFLRVSIMQEIGVVDKDLDRVESATEQVSPIG